MLVLINAMKSITRSKGRNILIGIIVLAIAASSCVALAIKSAANEAEAAGLENLSITGNITFDSQRMMMEAQSGGGMVTGGGPVDLRGMLANFQNLELEDHLYYADSGYIKNFYYSRSISLNAGGGLEAYSTDSADTSNNFEIRGNFGGGSVQMPGGSRIGMIAMGDFTVTGYSAEDAMTKFMNGTAKITDGGMFDVGSSEMECLISIELALFNGLEVGDTIELANPNSEDEIYIFTIAGIYTDSSIGDTGGPMMFSTSMDPANLICISYPALQSIMEHSQSVAVVEEYEDYGFEVSTAIGGQLSTTYVFSSKDNYDNFSEELTARGLSEYYALTSQDINNYESSLVPLKNLSDFATTLLVVVLIIGAVILIVINVFNIRERKYEVGVLTAIGIKKGKVAMQFVTELLCVTLVAIIIGAGVGAAASVPVANNLLSSQIEQLEAEAANQEASFGRPMQVQNIGGMQVRQNAVAARPIMDIFGSGAQGNVTYMDKINATFSFSIMSQLIGIGVLLTFISSFAAVIFVMRYEPLKILANRS